MGAHGASSAVERVCPGDIDLKTGNGAKAADCIHGFCMLPSAKMPPLERETTTEDVSPCSTLPY